MSGSSNKAIKLLTAEELSAFCLQLSYPVKAGITSAECIGLMIEETDEQKEKDLLTPVYQDLLAGETLSAALEKAGCFPDYMIQMLAIGQSSGNLDKVLHGLVDYYAKESERSTGIRRAITGPAVMLGVMAVLIIVLITQVLPVFNQVFMQMGTQMTGVALWLMNAGNVVRIIMIVVGIILVLAAVGVFFTTRSKSQSTLLSRIADRLFFRGRLGLSMGRARFASAMELMVSGGIDLDVSLEKAQSLLAGNPLEASISKCRSLVEKGENFPHATKETGIFTGVLGGILSSGFKAGNLESAMDELSQRCHTQSENMLENFIGRIEPTLIVILSVSVGLVLLSVMLPLISMLSSIGI